MNKEKLKKIILAHNKPLSPIPLDKKELKQYKQIGALTHKVKAVIFDVYGTMLVSAAGDIGFEQEANQMLFQVIQSKIDPKKLPKSELAKIFLQLIAQEHEQKKKQGIPYPEVDIVQIWSKFLALYNLKLSENELQELALCYELLINPCAPMPFIKEFLSFCKEHNLFLGIISNAQFYTPLLLETLLGENLSTLGFRLDLCIWSYQEGRAKPDCYLFSKLEKSIQKHGVQPQEILYIGNDRLKDIWPARQAGWQTALFAGDKRSFRWRDGLEKLNNCYPHLIIQNFLDIKKSFKFFF
ncbi:MAG: HAD family hydrolase [Desulfonauticus sp.]|nr:HAD family hydrolase [Desulfonauticus sp.]